MIGFGWCNPGDFEEKDKSMKYIPDDQDLSRGAGQLAKAIKQARQIMFDAPWVAESPDPEQERAAAERQLKHQLSAALDQGFILHDVCQPELRLLNQHNQFGLVNPDNRYHIANITTPGTYTLRGKRGTSADLQIQVGAGDPGFTDETNLDPVSLLSLDDLEVEDDGSFEITISDTDPGGNWLCNTNGDLTAKNLLLRESFMDWNTEVGTTWYLERTDTRGMPSPLPDRDLVNYQYERASQYLVASAAAWVNLVTFLRGEIPPGILSPPKETKLPGQYASAGFFRMRPDRAVIITLPKVPARYQAAQVGDLWFSGLDFCHRQSSLTLSQARESSDGLYRLVLSAQDPGVANWLDPAGASTAFVYVRWQGLQQGCTLAPSEFPRARVVRFDELRERLPDDEPDFSAEERVEQLAARQAAGLRSPRSF
ncbi:MAG: hypothetical protein AAF604_02575 [Acidobacteriota bacterium]